MNMRLVGQHKVKPLCLLSQLVVPGNCERTGSIPRTEEWEGLLQEEAHMAHGNVSPEGKAKVCFLPAPGLFQEDLCLVKPQRSVDMNHIQKIVFLHLSRCELIIYERMIFLEVKLFGFTTAIKCFEVLLKASRSYWKPVMSKQTNLWSVSSLSTIFQQNQQ